MILVQSLSISTIQLCGKKTPKIIFMRYVIMSLSLYTECFFGCETPRISSTIVENLKTVVDWFIEENFSYVRVYGCSIPPHALPKILPDRLICREVAHQLVNGGIGLELKAQQKNSWPSFPVYLGKFALLNFGHSKSEAESLSESKISRYRAQET
jgi:hypothetical protein